MGTDNLFHKRKAKSVQNLARYGDERELYDKVLIVCEGKTAEPDYFNGLIQHHKISSANVVITGESGSSPKSVVELAEELYRKEESLGNAFDRVFCVFDKDSHSTYQDTLSRLLVMKPPNIFVAITSVPAFEYWLFLHYEYSTRPYIAQPAGQSAGAQVLSDLKQYFPDYTKARSDIFFTLKDKLETAKTNAARVLQEAKNTNTDNPSTKVHKLVQFLQNIKP